MNLMQSKSMRVNIVLAKFLLQWSCYRIRSFRKKKKCSSRTISAVGSTFGEENMRRFVLWTIWIKVLHQYSNRLVCRCHQVNCFHGGQRLTLLMQIFNHWKRCDKMGNGKEEKEREREREKIIGWCAVSPLFRH